MTERWRRELRRLDEADPSEGLLARARRGPTKDLPERHPAPRGLVVLVAFAVFAASGVLVWRALEPGAAVQPIASRTPPTASPTPSATASGTPPTAEWPGAGASLPFASVDEALEFIRRNLDTEVALPTWLPPGVELDRGASVYAGSLGGRRSAQLILPLAEGGVLGIQYGTSALDGCASEASVPVRVSGQPGRLRYRPEYPWSELIWPATLAHPSGVYGLYGPFSRREILAMARSMPPVTGRVVVQLNC